MSEKAGSYYQFSLKQGEEIYLIVSPLADGVSKFMERVKEMRDSIPVPEGAAPPDRKPTNGAPPSSGEKSFVVESIKLATKGKTADQDRWVAKGGNFKKHGVTVWPEILVAAGLNPASLDDRQENTPTGTWTAFYSEKRKDDGNMTADKVVRLVKA